MHVWFSIIPFQTALEPSNLLIIFVDYNLISVFPINGALAKFLTVNRFVKFELGLNLNQLVGLKWHIIFQNLLRRRCTHLMLIEFALFGFGLINKVEYGHMSCLLLQARIIIMVI